MFSEENIKIEYNNCTSVTKKTIVECNTFLDHALSNIKCEFEEEDTKIHYGDLGNQLNEGNIDKSSIDITTLRDSAFPERFLKTEPTISNTFSEEFECNAEKDDVLKTALDYDLSHSREKPLNECNTFLDHGLSNIKCEFEEEDTKIYYGVLENQLHEENIHKSSIDITKLHDSAFPESSLKTKPTISNTFSEEFECNAEKDDAVKTSLAYDLSHAGEKPLNECNTFLDHGLSNIKCEFEEEDTKIYYGVLGNQLHEENIDKSSIDITKLHDSAFPESSLKIKPTINNTYSEEFECDAEKDDVLKTSLDYDLSHTEGKPFKCETCVKSFTRKKSLNLHIRSHTGEKPFKCETCGNSFTRKASLNRHIRSHTGEKPFKYGTSDKSFSHKITLNGHMSIHSGEKPFKCETCGKSFALKITLNTHMSIHTGEKPFQCGNCGKSFTLKRTLSDHMRTHTGEKPYKCETCGKCFIQKGILNSHMRIHTGEKPYKCEICDKSFTRKITLIDHVRIHTGEKPFQCGNCGKSFTLKGTLSDHMRIHTGEKPYKCETCGKCFIQKGDLNSHMKIHTGEKPYKCETCEKCFIQKRDLKSHMKIHTVEKPYKCKTCGECFSQNRYLNAHMRKIHI